MSDYISLLTQISQTLEKISKHLESFSTMSDYTDHLGNISNTLSDSWVWSWTAVASIATAAAVIIALLAPWVIHWLGRRPRRSNLIAKDSCLIKQVENLGRGRVEQYYVGRLAIKNKKGGFKAVTVEAYIEEIKDNGKTRKNFLPLPLQWTHGHLNQNRSVRDIHPNQTVYLDIFDFHLNSNSLNEALISITVAAGGEVSNFSSIKAEKTELLIRLYQESGQVGKIFLKVIWERKKTPDGEIEVVRRHIPEFKVVF